MLLDSSFFLRCTVTQTTYQSNQFKCSYDLICDTIAKCLKAIGGITKREPTPFTDEDAAKRPDIEWLIDDHMIFFDVSVTHPLDPTIRDEAATKQLAAALDRIKKPKIPTNKPERGC